MDRDRGRGGLVPESDQAATSFVGRGADVAAALQALTDALDGHARVLLIAGEPGIGKSRLADELAAAARDRGFRVAWGRCWEAGGAPAYWPWVQLLRSLTASLDIAELLARAGPGAVELAQLLPGLAAPSQAAASAAVDGDPDAARFRLFDAVTTFLQATAAAVPLMVIIDDLHVADTPSLLMLRFLADTIGRDRLLMLGTFRDSDLGPERSASPELTELARQPSVHRLPLQGLATADVSRFIEAATGLTPADGLAESLHDQTAGNPLFLQEVTRLLIDDGRLDETGDIGARVAFPRTVRDVILQRLRPFPADTLNVLTLASILGREFTLEALSRLAESPLDDVAALLEAAVDGRVIVDVPGAEGAMRFSHVVVRESLYDGVGHARRRELHRVAGGVLEHIYRGDLDPHLAELAHHFCAGATAEHADQAVAYARAAGRRAVALLAYEEAVRLYRMALRVLDQSEVDQRHERCELLLDLGDAQSRAGDEVGRKRSFLEAAELSKSLGSSDHIARAAIGYGGQLVWVRAGGDPDLIRLLEDGLAAVGPRDSVLRARLLARLAGARRDDPSPDAREALGREAVDVARRLGDEPSLAYALEGLFAALWRPGNASERLAICDEIIAVGERANDHERVMAAHGNRAHVFLELGDIQSAHDDVDAGDRIGRDLRQPAHSWIPLSTRAELALLEGRFADVEPLIAESFRIRSRTNRADAVEGQAIQLFQLCRELGRPHDAEELLREAERQLTWYPVLRCALAWLQCELGRPTQARRVFESLAVDDFAPIPFDNKWLFAMSLLSETACFLEDVPRARVLYDRLQPYAGLCAVSGGDICAGSMDRYLGLLAATMGRTDDAVGHLNAGLVHNQRMGARPAVTHTAYELALTLLSSRRGADPQRVVDLLRTARVTCDELGMLALRDKVLSALTDAGAVVDESPVETAASAPVAPDTGTCRLEGEYWTVGYGGQLVRLRDSKGMRVLARLLAAPGRPYPALDLERLGSPGDEATVRAAATGDAGELLDDEARRAYRARVVELRASIEDAEGAGRADEVGMLREELDFITRELSRALGLGGRSRHAGSAAERARINVTRAVRSAMQRIATADATLAAHLDACVRTGTVCVYRPDPRSPIAWQVSTE